MKDRLYIWVGHGQLVLHRNQIPRNDGQASQDLLHWHPRPHVRSNKPELLCYSKVAVLEAVIHVLHNWDPRVKCVWEREREHWRVFPLFHCVLGPRWASQYGLTAALCRQEPREQRSFHQLYSLSSSSCIFFSHSYCDFVKGQRLTVALFFLTITCYRSATLAFTFAPGAVATKQGTNKN